jgi:2-polyprenyl-3-methyl-5-hydroxy-6-metoxy-1,4-benzoquinol methylase
MNKQEIILKALESISEGVELLRSTINVDEKQIALPKKTPTTMTENEHRERAAITPDSISLGPAPNYQDPKWPVAIDPDLIVTNGNDAEKQYRAVQIIDSLKIPLNNVSILDYGCGEGHIAYEAAQTADRVVGYDIQRNDVWDNKIKDNLYFITDKSAVKHHAPYDNVILFDVLDHVKDGSQLEILKNINSWLSEDGHVFIRTHPWTSKHGGHLYEDINKAYVHLVLTPAELPRNIKSEYVEKITKPLATYEGWFKNSGFVVDSKTPEHESVSDYFNDDLIKRIIKINWDHEIDIEMVKKIMSMQAIDYVLSRSK